MKLSDPAHTCISSLHQPSVVMVARSHTATHHLLIREGVTSTILAIKLANQLLKFGCRVMPFRLVNSKGNMTALIHAGRKHAIALSSNGCPYLHHNTSFVMLKGDATHHLPIREGVISTIPSITNVFSNLIN